MIRCYDINLYKSKSGVYSIYNTVTNMVYIGSAINLKTRYMSHCRNLRTNQHDNHKLQKAYNKYGVASFEFHILLSYSTCADVVEKEQLYMDLCQSHSRCGGYNLKPEAKSMKGYVHTDETKARISNSLKGRVFSDETKAKLSAAASAHLSANKHAKAKLLTARSLRGYGDDVREKMSLAKKNDAGMKDRMIALGQKKRLITPVEALAINSAFASGCKPSDLATQYGVCTRTIRNYLDSTKRRVSAGVADGMAPPAGHVLEVA